MIRYLILGSLLLCSGTGVREGQAQGGPTKTRERSLTVITEATRTLTFVFRYSDTGELRNIDIKTPSPPDGDAQLEVKDTVVATDGTRIPVSFSWDNSKPRTLASFLFLPDHPQPQAGPEEMVTRSYRLRTTNGSVLRLACDWVGKNVSNIRVEPPPV